MRTVSCQLGVYCFCVADEEGTHSNTGDSQGEQDQGAHIDGPNPQNPQRDSGIFPQFVLQDAEYYCQDTEAYKEADGCCAAPRDGLPAPLQVE